MKRRTVLRRAGGFALAGPCRAAAGATVAMAAGLGAPVAHGARLPLVLWHTPEGARALRESAVGFTRDTGVPVVVETPDEGPVKFQQAASAGKGPDLYVYAHDRIGEWIAAGLLHAVNPHRAMREDIDPLAWRGYTQQGRLWGYPMSVEAITLIYNKALVQRPPQSWDEVFDIDRRLRPQGRRAILWDYTNNYFTFSLLAAGGAYSFGRRADGSIDPQDVGVAVPGAVRGAQVVERLIREGVMPAGSGYPEMEAAMASGRVAMMINGPWSWVNLRRAGIDFGVARLPRLDGRPCVPFVGVKGIMVNRNTRQRELCAELVEHHLLSPAGLRRLDAAEPLGAAASRAFFAELSADERIRTIMDSAQDGVPTPNNPEMGRFWSVMKTALNNLSEGRQDARTALETAARRLRAG
ncbi:MAG: maltose/maltodextrin ABC transporter substrate-binding protein MalE [Betaproteobacteria bacterium]